MPAKKDVLGNWTEKRMCGDYRPINAKSKTDRYQMPTPEDMFDQIGHAKVFSTLDMRSGYHQIPLRPSDKSKTAFWGVDADNRDVLYQWRVLPFGLRNAPAEFQRVMDGVLRGLPFARCYIDDIIVFSDSPEQHIVHLQAVFERIRDSGLKLHSKKCTFFQSEIAFLGHMITPNGLGVQKAKVDALNQIPVPTDISRLRAFLGLASYYRKFVRNFSTLASPLNRLLKNNEAWVWGPAQHTAFETLKDRLSSAPVLRRPDPTLPYALHTDWSALGLGAVLTQRDSQGEEYVVAYASRSNNAAEAKYSSYEGECLAAVWAIVHFRPYLFGTPFELVTDHQPLKWLMTSDKLTGKLARWALILQEYDFTVSHRAGTANMDADGLSRNPNPSSSDSTHARHHGTSDSMEVPGWCGATTSAPQPSSTQARHTTLHPCTALAWTPAFYSSLSTSVSFPCQKGAACQGVCEFSACLATFTTSESTAWPDEAVGQPPLTPRAAQAATVADGGATAHTHTLEEPQYCAPIADPWTDQAMLGLLHTGAIDPTLARKERDRVVHRAARFLWHNDKLYRLWRQGSGTVTHRRLVPPPDQRGQLIAHAHEAMGHYGVARTAHLLRLHYWWPQLYTHVKTFVQSCEVCDRVRSGFNAPMATLHPLPIMGLGYRWSLDYAGPFGPTPTERGNRYVLVMVEHYSKWVECVPLPGKEAEHTARAFLANVVSRFGAPAEVLTDQGGEFLGAFSDLCTKYFIDHRTTSRQHPEGNGLAERMVQSIKKGLRKYALIVGNNKQWDEHLPLVLMGYRFSRQEALAKFSPYQLLYGTNPHFPSAVADKLEKPVDLDNPEVWARTLLERARFLEQAMPLALGNLKIAQQRDTERYQTIRGGGYKPQVRRFLPGDFIYLQKRTPTTVDTKAGRTILRVVKALPTGVLELEGKCGKRVKDLMRNCAPCHLPIDGSMDFHLANIPASLKCHQCGSPNQPAKFLLCDACQRGWHTFCLPTPLDSIPVGRWYCPLCQQE